VKSAEGDVYAQRRKTKAFHTATGHRNRQHFWMRIAVALSASVPEALKLYQLFSQLDYIPSSPTLFNAGTRHEEL